MISFLTLAYVGVLALLIFLKILPNQPKIWASTIVWMILLLVILFIPMQWGAPSGSARVMAFTIQIIPNVSGPVIEVPVQPNVPLKKGDVLFKLDPSIFAANLRAKKAQLNFQRLRLEQYKQLASGPAGTRFQVEETEAQVEQLEGEVESAEWNLRETIVRAPSKGYVTYVALRPGQRITNLPLQPAMTFIDTSQTMVGVQINQIYTRHLQIGQPVELAFKTKPGQIFTGKVEAIVQVTSEGQALISGTVPQAQAVQAQPFFIRVRLDKQEDTIQLPAGTVGTAAIYTEATKFAHVIRKVMLRMESILNYINPWL